MKILIITSSPRKEKSQTLLLANEVLKGCTANKKVVSETVQLCDLKIDFCHHCEFCHKNILLCPIKDDVLGVLDKMLNANGIIFASPNYINQITASMKALFDRSSHFIHCLRLLDKYTAGVVTSGSGKDQDVLNYIKYYSNHCGAQYSGGINGNMPINEQKKQEAINLGKKLVSDIQEKKIFPEQADVIKGNNENFKRIMQLRRMEWLEEYQYWLDKGWL